jgi:hypothetical protein
MSDKYTIVRCITCMGTGEHLSMVGQPIDLCKECKGLCFVRVKKSDFAVYAPKKVV